MIALILSEEQIKEAVQKKGGYDHVMSTRNFGSEKAVCAGEYIKTQNPFCPKR